MATPTPEQIAALPEGAHIRDDEWMPVCVAILPLPCTDSRHADGCPGSIRTYTWDACDACGTVGWVSHSFDDCWGNGACVATCVSCASVEVIETTAALLSHNL